jgi:hypothetical protein
MSNISGGKKQEVRRQQVLRKREFNPQIKKEDIMKRSRKSKELYFTLTVLVFFVLLFLATTSIAQSGGMTRTQQDLRYVTSQYKEFAANYLPGTQYEKAMDELILMIDRMDEDQASVAAQYLKPILPSMLANLELMKEGLSHWNDPRALSYGSATSLGFPDAAYPDIQPINFPALIAPVGRDLLSFIPAVAGLFINFDFGAFAPSALNAIPFICRTVVDAEGIPTRVPDLTLMTLRTAAVGLEAVKEMANTFFEQTAVAVGAGGNLKWITVFTTGAWLIAKVTYENIKSCDDMISGAEAAASYRRLGHIHGDLENVNIKIDTAKGDLSSIKNSLAIIDTKLNTVIQLLKTPQGQRPGFPLK